MLFRHHRLPLLVAVAAAVLLLVDARGGRAAQPDSPAACDIRTTERVVAVGDVHGAYDRFIAILRAAGLIDGRARWTGGRAILVQTGDVVDRGPDSRRVLDLLRRLEREAARAGGRVYPLLGNHEVMRMVSDWRYVSAEELAAFRTADSANVRDRIYELAAAETAQRARTEKRVHDERAFREQFLKDIPLGFIEMRWGFAAAGEYGKWLRELPAVIRINGIVYVHGGIDATTAALGCDAINDAVRRDLAVANPSPEQAAAMFSSSEKGPLWYRGLAEEPEPAIASDVTSILRTLGARAIVVGHTVPPSFRITTRFDGRVIPIDTGMLGGTWYPGGVASALEIRGDALTAIYENGRMKLGTLPPMTADAAAPAAAVR